jgi:hypothetical protein
VSDAYLCVVRGRVGKVLVGEVVTREGFKACGVVDATTRRWSERVEKEGRPEREGGSAKVTGEARWGGRGRVRPIQSKGAHTPEVEVRRVGRMYLVNE